MYITFYYLYYCVFSACSYCLNVMSSVITKLYWRIYVNIWPGTIISTALSVVDTILEALHMVFTQYMGARLVLRSQHGAFVVCFDRNQLMSSMEDLLFYTITDGKEMIPLSLFFSVSQKHIRSSSVTASPI